MAENKRYYWLRFKEDFFSSKRIKKLRKLGADYLIIYLKMQLKALKSNGYLEITGLEQNVAAEIALDIDEDEDKVQVALSYLQACGLVEASTDNLFLPYVQENTGSETASAQRVREFRANQKALQCNTDVTEVKQPCNVEKEIEKELEIDKEKEIKKDKKKNNKAAPVYYPNDEKLNDAFADYVAMRKQIKAPMTDRAVTLAMNKLTELSGGDNDLAIDILNQSVMNSWKGLFELKRANKPSGNSLDDWANA